MKRDLIDERDQAVGALQFGLRQCLRSLQELLNLVAQASATCNVENWVLLYVRAHACDVLFVLIASEASNIPTETIKDKVEVAPVLTIDALELPRQLMK